MPVVIQFFKDINPTKLVLAGLGLLTFIILFVVFLSKISDKDMAILYSDLDVENSNKVIEELETKKIPYQLIGDGAVVKVPSDQVARLRVTLAQAGIPNKGSIVGYEIFDKEDSIGTTNFSQNIKFGRALEGELSRTISAIDQIDKARVHLVLPQKEIFSKERLEPRASIVLKLKNNKTLSKSEIEAVGHLVVTSVPGLDIKNITIVDTKGKSLKLGTKDEEGNFGNGQNEEYRIAYENRLKKIIEDLLEQTLGAGKVKAQVNIEMNFDRIVTNSEIYDPDSAVVRSTQAIDEKERTPVGGDDNIDVSVANNIPPLGGGSDDQNSRFATIEKSDQTTNYEISKTIKNHISETGVVKSISIGVLVDGNYKLNIITNETDYTPRSKEELDQIANLVKVAVGFNDDRNDKIEVINMPFANDITAFDEDDTNWLKDELPNIFQTLVFAIVVLLVLVTVIRPIALKAFEVKRNGDFADSTGGDGGFSSVDQLRSSIIEAGGAIADVVKAERSPTMETNAHKLNELIVSYPHETIIVLRKWLNENS
jgi:flagellar M-ring protein FliF